MLTDNSRMFWKFYVNTNGPVIQVKHYGEQRFQNKRIVPKFDLKVCDQLMTLD